MAVRLTLKPPFGHSLAASPIGGKIGRLGSESSARGVRRLRPLDRRIGPGQSGRARGLLDSFMLLQDDGTRLPPMEDGHLEPTIQVPMDWPTPVNEGSLRSPVAHFFSMLD